MPTYDYECDGCGHRFELFQGITAPVETECPECHEPKLRRLFGTGGAIMFKGSGFYQTDYRSDSYKSRAKADRDSNSGSSKSESPSSSTEKSSSSSSDAKPTKPAPKKDA